MKEPLILTIDVGTQSTRVALFNKKGEIVGIEKHEYEVPYISEKKGQAEVDPNYYYEVICKTTKALKEKFPNEFENIIGVALDTLRDTAVILDENYKPIHRSILWLDQRYAKTDHRDRPFLHKILYSILNKNNTVDLNMHKSMSLWYQTCAPDVWKKAKYYCNISGYLDYLMTGEYKDSPAAVIGHYPLNFKKGVYYKKTVTIKNIYNVPYQMLPELVPVGGLLGKINKKTSELTGIKEGTPMYSIGSDKSCESLGTGALSEYVATISYGTASSIEVTTKKYHDSEPFLPSFPSVAPGYYNMDIQIYRGYWMINWFLKYFCHYNFDSKEEKNRVLKEFDSKLPTIPPGSDGLILQPYWQPGLSRPLSRGSVIGFTDTHTSVHFYRAIIEGVCFALREAAEHFEKKTHRRILELRISGGGSQSPEICQITADIFGIPVKRVQTFETSSLGAAISGFVAAKEFKNSEEAVKSMVHLRDEFKPDMKAHKLYNDVFYNGYVKIYPSLSKIYKKTCH